MSDRRQRNHFRIAVIPGDGIGREVVPEGCAVLEAAAKKHGFDLRLDTFDFASYEYYARHRTMLPDDWKSQIGSHDAIFFGAVGWGPRRSPTTCRSGGRCCSSGVSSTSTSISVPSV
jgi:tartrate dehydrogenase/decarboxylase/D-malate dehydrogenase